MKTILTFLTFLIIGISASAQIKGKVVDALSGEPLVGATVQGKNAVATDLNGTFSVEAADELTISYIGYTTQKLQVKQNYLVISLQPSTLAINEVVVSAYNTKRPLLSVAAPIALLTKADLNRADNNTLIPILNAVPGVKIDYYTYGDYRLNIRGGALAQPSVHSSGYRMYWNDIPITSASGGNPLGGLDLNFINNLEIIKGPGSAMYGAGFGGTVLVNTERASQNGTTLNADVMLGGYGTLRASTGVRSNWSQGSLALQYTRSQSEGFRNMTDTEGDIFNLFGQLYTGQKGTLSYLFNYENRSMNIAGDLDKETFLSAPETANTIEPTGFGPKKTTFGAGYNYRFNNKISASLGGYYFDNEGEFVMSFPFFAIFDQEPSNGWNSRATLNYKEQWGETQFKLVAGLEYAFANNEGISYNGDFNTDTAKVTNINRAKTNQSLFFVQSELALPSDWYLSLGASYNNYDYDVRSAVNSTEPLVYTTNANQLVPRMSILKKMGKASVYAALGQGFSPPAAGIFNDFLNFDGSVNNNLRSATGWNLELGSRGSTKNGVFFYDLTFYHLKVKDAIISRLFEIAPGVNAERKTNAGKVKQLGLEASLGLNLSTSVDHFWYGSQLRVGYTFNDYTYEDYQTFVTDFDADFNPIYRSVSYNGKSIPGTIPHAWVFMLDLRTKPGFYLNYTLNTYGSAYLTDANTDKVDAYTLMNVRLGYSRPVGQSRLSLHPYLGFNNLGNTLYSSLTAYNSTFGGFYNAGYRRQFYAGLQVNLKL